MYSHVIRVILTLHADTINYENFTYCASTFYCSQFDISSLPTSLAGVQMEAIQKMCGLISALINASVHLFGIAFFNISYSKMKFGVIRNLCLILFGHSLQSSKTSSIAISPHLSLCLNIFHWILSNDCVMIFDNFCICWFWDTYA